LLFQRQVFLQWWERCCAVTKSWGTRIVSTSAHCKNINTWALISLQWM
jgi:hypothetical protein